MREKKEVIRVMAQIPLDIHEKLEKIALSEHRSVSSVVVQACDHYTKIRETRPEGYASSPEYLALLDQLKKDLGRK
jgi:hypothetical protein